jgi:hypothetical protein
VGGAAAPHAGSTPAGSSSDSGGTRCCCRCFSRW